MEGEEILNSIVSNGFGNGSLPGYAIIVTNLRIVGIKTQGHGLARSRAIGLAAAVPVFAITVAFGANPSLVQYAPYVLYAAIAAVVVFSVVGIRRRPKVPSSPEQLDTCKKDFELPTSDVEGVEFVGPAPDNGGGWIAITKRSGGELKVRMGSFAGKFEDIEAKLRESFPDMVTVPPQKIPTRQWYRARTNGVGVDRRQGAASSDDEGQGSSPSWDAQTVSNEPEP